MQWRVTPSCINQKTYRKLLFLYHRRNSDFKKFLKKVSDNIFLNNHRPKNLCTQVGFAESKETANDQANIDGTIIGVPIIGQLIVTDHQSVDCRPMIGLILSRQLLVCLYRADVPTNSVSPIIGLLVLDRFFGYYRSTNLWFTKARRSWAYHLSTDLRFSILAH